MQPTQIDDSEILYRSVRAENDEYRIEDTKLVFSVKAFDDRTMKPSVSRSLICTDPAEAKLSERDGITKCLAHEVRSINNVVLNPDKDGNGDKRYEPDAIHRPLDPFHTVRDKSHSQVECVPELANKGRFKRLKEALAQIATTHGFVIPPTR